MDSLLGLPRELRDEIINLVLHSPISPPPSVERQPCGDISQLGFERRIHYLASHDAYRPTALGLLLTNRQLHTETREALAKMSPISFELDLAFVDECWLWPTWRFIPTKTHPCLEILVINIRLCCSPEMRELQTRFSWRHTGHAYPIDPMLQTLCGFLHRFFSLGAIGDLPRETEPRETNQDLRVKQLVINIGLPMQDNETVSHQQLPGRVVAGLRHHNNDCLYAVDQGICDQFGTWLANIIRALVSSSPQTSAANVLRDRIGIISCHYGGDTKFLLDMSEFLSLSPRVDAAFRAQKWKERKELGL